MSLKKLKFVKNSIKSADGKAVFKEPEVLDNDEISFASFVEQKSEQLVSNTNLLSSAVYQIQLRLPAEMEFYYKSLSPRMRKVIRDAFAELIIKAYNKQEECLKTQTIN